PCPSRTVPRVPRSRSSAGCTPRARSCRWCRCRWPALACVLAICPGSSGKIAHARYSLQKTETAELEEPCAIGKVGSSTMPHKRNPPTCETVVALARLVRNTAPMALESIMAEHERDKIVLQTEREFISRLCCMCDAAAAKIAYVCANLTVPPANMEKNLFIQRGLLMSEAVMMGLSDRLGRQEAHEIVYEVCMDVFERGGDFREALLANEKVAAGIDAATIDRMLDPHGYTGMAGAFVDRVVGKRAG
ncbi:MAG: hypothetical protein E6Q40_04830, partial [Cupriavidus sp.]